MSGLEHLDANRRQDAANHDRWAAGLSPETVIAAAQDLHKQPRTNPKDHEQRWTMGRLAALLRRIDKERLHSLQS